MVIINKNGRIAMCDEYEWIKEYPCQKQSTHRKIIQKNKVTVI